MVARTGASKFSTRKQPWKNNRGLMFTVAAALFAVILIGVVAVRIEQTREHSESLSYRVRCDELNSFLTDMEKDLARANEISGTRAIVYLSGQVVFNGTVITDAETTIRELVTNGTINKVTIPDLENETLPRWAGKFLDLASDRNFETNLNESLIWVDIVPFEGSAIQSRAQIQDLFVNDTFGYCSFNGTLPRFRSKIISNISVINLEDPLYALGSHGYATRVINLSTVSKLEHNDPSIMKNTITQETYFLSSDGPSFLERLEGNLGSPGNDARHQYYIGLAYNAALEDNMPISSENLTIGLETFVDVTELRSRIPNEVQPLVIKENQSVVDHLFFDPIEQRGQKMTNVSNTYSWFRIDAAHAAEYNISGGQLYD